MNKEVPPFLDALNRTVVLVFICFLVEKSLRIHELMQFVVYFSNSQDAFTNWEHWRRSRHSVLKRVRPWYYLAISLPPTIVAAVIAVSLSYALWSGPPKDATSFGWWAIVALIVVIALHLIPFAFFYQNSRPTNLKWIEINRLRKPDFDFDKPLNHEPTPKRVRRSKSPKLSRKRKP